MDHSLYGYLSRRTTEELKQIHTQYSIADPPELNVHILHLTREILRSRGIGFPEGAKPPSQKP